MPDPPAPRLRPPLPTLVELGQVSATETLRPPGAVPPPPRPIPGLGRGHVTRPMPAITLHTQEDDRESVPATTPALEGRPDREAIPHTERRPDPPPLEPVLPPSLEAPRVPAIPIVEGSTTTTPSTGDEDTPKIASSPATPARSLDLRRKLLPIGAGVAAGLVVLGVWQLTRDRSDTAQAASPSEAASDPAPKPVAPCRVTGEPRKLAGSVHLAVPVVAQTMANGRIALAYATSPTDAVGLTLDPETLDAAQAFAESGKAKLFSVIPVSSATDRPTFATSRASAGATGGGLVELPNGVAQLAASAQGLRVELTGGAKHLAWPEAASAQSTSPRAEPLGSTGALLTWRRNGQQGEIVVGQIDAEGRPTGAVSKVTSNAEEFGTPSLAVSAKEALLGFASRSSSSAPWRIELARAPLGQLPAASRPFVPEGLAPDATTISPAAAALPGGGWLLQWTQGEQGKHRVFLQTLDENLTPVGAPLTAGPADKEAGQGTPWVGADQRAASFYIVRSGKDWELWGTALECPR